MAKNRYIKLALSSLVTVLSFVPTWAQSSFMQVYGSVSDDRPSGIFETNEQNLVFFGSSGYQNYACMINGYGQVFWEHIYNNKSDGDMLKDGFQLNDTTLVLAGDAGFQAQEANPRVTFIHTNGTIIKDTFYPLTALTAGGVHRMINVPEKNYIFSVGAGLIRNPGLQGSLYVQKTDYTGKRLFSKQITPNVVGHLFKHPQQEKYFVFGKSTKITLDSNANQIGTIDSIVPIGHELLDIVQLEDGSYYSFIDDNFFGYYVQKLDIEGLFVENWLTLPNNRDTLIYGSSLHRICVNNKKEVALAGYTFLVIIDSLKQVKASKPLLPYYSGILTKIKPSKDGGFYGVGWYFANFDSSSYDIYVFKTKPNGDIRTTVIEPQKLWVNVNIYPNPSKGIFTISGVAQNATAQITDVLGKVVVPQFNVSNNAPINCEILSKGTYFINIFVGQKQHRQIILIQ